MVPGSRLVSDMDAGRIEALLLEDKADEVIAILEGMKASGEKPGDRHLYLLGNAYRKKGDWKGAMENYLEAVELNPESPAAAALQMAGDIMAFYNKDLYNP